MPSGVDATRGLRAPVSGRAGRNARRGAGQRCTCSGRVLAVQYARHPERERSHLEFYWPIQLTAALPRHPDHRVVFFLHHHSGGWTFHRGGVNSLGVGYRRVLGAR